MSAIGIIGAMDVEIIGILAEMKNISTTTVADINFHEGKLADKDIVLARCGVGKVNAAMCTQAMVDKFEVQGIINLGVAGAINNALNINDVVVSQSLVQHDFDVTPTGNPPGHIPALGVEIFADKDLAAAAIAACREVLGIENNAYAGVIATGDQFVADKDDKNRISRVFNAHCVEMEGAAIAQVCKYNQVPFVVIRAISDKADGSADMDFETFVTAAAANSSKIVTKLVEKL